MLNRIIEIHDSVLEKVLSLEHSVELYVSCVYIHQSQGRPGIDPGSGWIQRAILRISEAKIDGNFAEFPVDLTDGQIQLGEYHEATVIPIPLNFTGAFALQLTPMWHPEEVVTFTGSSAQLELIGEPEYVEEFRPD